MPLKNNIEKVKRAARLSEILIRYGFEELFDRSGIEKFIPEKIANKSKRIENITSQSLYERIRLAAEEMGPAYVKFGQMLSNRNDIFPEEFIIELQKLQDNVEPENIDIYEKLEEELEIIPSEYFESIEKEPMASASMGQVFKGVLKTGKEVVIKVRRGNLESTVSSDIMLMKDLAKGLERKNESLRSMNLTHIIETFENMMKEEMSLTNELKNMEHFARNFRNDERIHTPEVYRELSNNSILCMELIKGIKVNDKEEIIKLGFDPKDIADTGLDLYMKQVLTYGFFHADPHPGNIFLTEEGKIVFIDFGAMGTLLPRDRELLEDMTIYFVQKNVRKIIATIKELSLEYGVSDEKKLERGIYEIIAMIDENSLADISLGEKKKKMRKIFSENNVLLPENIYLLLKGIGQIEGIGRNLNPDLDMTKVMQPYAQEITRKRISPQYVMGKGIEKFEIFSENWLSLPDDIKSISQKILNNELRHKHEIIGFEQLQKILEQLVLSIIIAALVIGGAILVSSEIPPRIHGVSTAGLICFIIAAVLGIRMLSKKK